MNCIVESNNFLPIKMLKRPSCPHARLRGSRVLLTRVSPSKQEGGTFHSVLRNQSVSMFCSFLQTEIERHIRMSHF